MIRQRRPIYHQTSTMPTPLAIVRCTTPEEAELPLRRAELARLREDLNARDTQLDELRTQLHHFEGRYIRQVGVLYAQLDEWETRITQLQVSAEPIEVTERLLQQANENAGAGAPGLDSETWVSTESKPNQQTLDLRAVFREVAKRIHPDFARDADDEIYRNRLMAQANDALRREDAALLHRMVRGHDLPHHTADAAAELAATRILLQQLQQDLTALDDELAALAQSDMADLRNRTVAAALRGQDLLAELAAQVKGRIGIAMRRYELDLIRIRRKEPLFNPQALLSAESPS